MTRSTEILLRPLSARFAIIMGSAFFSFLLGVSGMSPVVSALVISALALTTVIILDRELLAGRYIFPISPHQIAWIPRGTFTLAMALSCVMFMPGLLVRSELSFFDVLGSWTFTTMLLLIFARVMTRWPNSVGMWPVFMIHFTRIPEISELQLSAAYIPLWLTGIALFLWEAPHFEALVRQLDYHKQKYSYSVEFSGPSRPHLITQLASLVTIAIGLLFFLPVILPDALGWWIFGGALTVLSYFLLRDNRASGMSWGKAMAVLAMELTVVGFAFRTKLGVQHGCPVLCGVCRKLKMAWMAQCPHCESLQKNCSGCPVQRTEAADFAETAIGPTFFRVLVPMGLVIWILLNNWKF